MSKISATIVADSKNQQGDRITTMLVTFPRFILAELNTHRMLSKNSASSRAIPFKKMVEAVQNNPFIPIAWQKDHKGMQGNEYLDENHSKQALYTWLGARDLAVEQATDLYKVVGVTKQLCNRLLEPFMWHTVLITATEWENFFNLRCPQYITPVGGKNEDGTDWIYRSRKDVMQGHSNEDNLKMMSEFTDLDWLKLNKGQAEIHMMALAEAMWDAMNESTPKELEAGQWHIPFEDKIDEKPIFIRTQSETIRLDWIPMPEIDGDWVNEWRIIEKVKISTAMCARTSYTIVGDEKEFSYDKQIELHDRMANQVPFHASPFEHCAKAMSNEEYNTFIKGKSIYEVATNSHIPIGDSLGWCRNYKGFIQYRELLENKNK